MSDNQAATVNTIKSKDEFINWLKQNKSFCGLTVTQIDDSECVFNSDNKKAYFKIFLDDNASFQFGVFTGSTPDLKKEFEERLKKAGGQVDGEIKTTAGRGVKPAKITLNSTTFTVGTNQKNYYLVIKKNSGQAVPYSELEKSFGAFVRGVKDSGIGQLFYDVFGEKDEKKRGRSKMSNNQENSEKFSSSDPRQIIYFGAPGTSKSYTLNKDAEKKDEVGNKVFANQERVTFYPGYSYQQFVGTYKPFMDGDKISYKFVPGPLLRLLEKALKAEKAEKAKPQNENKAEAPAAEPSTENQENGKEEKEPEKFLLIVEELNRAEAAAVFGDLFQLLDRNSDGESEYPISVSEDLKQYLRRNNGNDVGVWENEPEDTQKKLYFPSNFYIWATMNSADQGVFPLDTAFKRRWDFKYFGIDDAADKLTNDKQKFWNKLRQTINKALQKKLTLNEDKLLGPFFMKVENIDEQTFWERFCSKVLLYLYEDAARLNRNRIFQSKITYSQMFAKFAEFRGVEEKWQDDLKTIWEAVFASGVKLEFDAKFEYPSWTASENDELGTAEEVDAVTDDGEAEDKPATENDDENNEQ